MNIATLLTNAAKPFADRPAIFSGERQLATYAELLRNADGIGGWLRRQGVRPGDRVGLFMSNVPEYFEALFGIWMAGACAVPVNAKLHAKEIAYILGNCQAGILFATGDRLETVAAAGEGAEAYVPRQVLVPGTDAWQEAVAGPAAGMAEVAPDDIAWLFYTSGTTGRPKGAMLTHRNLFNMTLSFLADLDPIDQFDCCLHPAPISHAGGLLSLSYLARGAANVVPVSGGFEPPEIVSLVNRFPGSSLFAAPTMVKRLLLSPAIADLDLEHLDSIIYGGAPMYVEELKQALAAFGPRLWQAFGQGEAPCTITYLPKKLHLDIGDGRLEQRLASVGIARTGVEVRVVDGDDNDVPPGETGEVIVRGDVVMVGYWNNPEATAAALRNGWLHTGDVGSFDECGYLTLKDRAKDMIISGGSNIYPREVEEVLLTHPGIVEASVIGRRHEEWGEEVVAIVVRRDGHEVTEADLDKLCIDNIARFKRPKRYHFVDGLPKNNYGKILKTELRKTFGK
ncbi:acyl-CoA synthetase [Oceanibacterium hippocampi]|uniref:3-methylmercaptopropionyl-CoA ligase n=1 Tax=Oceanibacterium hippocampi TaxID=745714 RepID=A0A1Y5RRW3_9PROT|nr:long-chain fatty acid--CoA ligase [Oceanibacterium hippocampi]SLN23940.1 Long-chain-fatty-acid--CoA ligase [Oceanibacterium hippocampi]